MPVPSTINDLSTTAGSNSPAGSDSPATIDDHIRALAAFIAQLRDRPQPSAFGLTLIDDADAATAQQTLGGTAVGRAVFTAADAAAALTAILAAGTGVANTFTGANIFTGTLTQQSASEARVRAEKTGTGASSVYLYNSETQVGVWDTVEGGIWNVDKATGTLTIPRNVSLDGFTRIGGASSPGIKILRMTGTTPAEGSSAGYGFAYGDHGGRIDDVSLWFQSSFGWWIKDQNHVSNATVGVTIAENRESVSLSVATGQTGAASRPFRMIVTLRQE